MVVFEEIEEFFTIKGNRPLCLTAVLVELVSEKQYVVLKNESEIDKLSQYLENNNTEKQTRSFFQSILGYLQSTRFIIANTDIIVNKSLFQREYSFCKNKLKEVF